MTTAIYKGTIVSKRHLTPTAVELECRVEPTLDYQAGQYVMMGFPDLGPDPQDPPKLYPLALASAPSHPTLTFCIRTREGNSITALLDEVEVGSETHIEGPGGSFLYNNPERHPVVFVATGTGVAPLRSMIRSTPYHDAPPVHSTLVLGLFTEDDILYPEEWGTAVSQFVPVLSDPVEPWDGETGWVTQYLERAPETFFQPEAQYYICGQYEMLGVTKEILMKRGVPENKIYLSQ